MSWPRAPDQKFPAAPRSTWDAHCLAGWVDSKARERAARVAAASNGRLRQSPARPYSECDRVGPGRQWLRYRCPCRAADRYATWSCDRESSTAEYLRCPPGSAGQRRSDFPRQHQQRKIPGNHLPDNSAGLMIGEFLIQQLSPSGVIVKMPGNQRDIDVTAFTNGLAVIHGLEHGEQPGMFLNQPCQ